MVYLKGTEMDWNYTSVQERSQQCHRGGVATITRAKMLGGCSSNNFMLYVRGDPHDFNTWADILNDESWNYENVLKYFIKSENLLDSEVLNSPYKIFHGTNGSMNVTRQPSKSVQKYLEAFRELGHETVLDTNGNYTLGYTEPMFTLGNGVRQSTANSFLSTIKDRKNLYISKNTLATKVIFDDNKNAIGIKVINEYDEEITLKTNKEVIVSAGSINTPQLLMLSGIGPKKHLQDMGIAVISDLPVGENLQDHAPVIMAFATDKINSTEEPMNPHRYLMDMVTGYVALNKSQLYPDYQAIGIQGREIFYVICSVLKPKSRGRILLRSLDPKEHPIIHLGHFTDTTDIEDAVAYIKDVHELMNTQYFKNVNAEFLITPNCAGLEPDSDEFWQCHVLCAGTTIFHYVSTCAMGTVLDSQLRVTGVQRLRVVDGSAMPVITSGNTNAPSIMLAEKAADMIKQDNTHP
ncbi:ecdysone oxidase-like [Aphomia sociella]